MFDFALTQKGDLIFVQDQTKKKALKISFILSNSIARKIQFNILDAVPETELSNGMKISFMMEELPYNKSAMIVQGDIALSQALKIRLSTSIGELKYRTKIGSMLESVKHKQIFNDATLIKTQNAITDAIKDLIADAEVDVVPYVTRDNGYSQGLKLCIYQNGFLIFNHDLEG
jgi:phage baseplate assembly protein W